MLKRQNQDEIVSSLLEIEIGSSDDFLKIKETLSRIGIVCKKTKTLYQSCYILHKKKKYYIVHFKELFKLDGCLTDISEEDILRRNTIALLLESWNLLKIVTEQALDIIPISTIKIIQFKDKVNWTFEEKYSIGKK